MPSQENNPPRTKTGCQNCRLRHLKCDERRPACARCEKGGIECIRGYNIRFRHGANPSISTPKKTEPARKDYDFSKSQPWVKTAQSLTFLDETRELMNIYDHELNDESAIVDSSPWDKAANPPRSIPQPTSNPSTARQASQQSPNVTNDISIETFVSPAKRRRLTSSQSYHSSPILNSPHDLQYSPPNSWHHPSPHTGWTPSASDSIVESLAYDPALTGLEPTSATANNAPLTLVSDSLSRIYLETSAWPLSDREEARLLRYYVEHIARNFDLTDPYRHFRNVVPQRAASCPPLLNAIFALTARHLSRVGEYDPLISDKYHQECLKHLIPMLDDQAAVLDENLLASAIILRHLEEIEVPLTGQSPSDQQSHLLGSHAFITAQERATVAGGLRQAAFWVGLRQEIYVAFVNQRSIIPALEHCNIDRTWEAAADHVWSCRMVVICADIIRYCFGEGDPLTSTYNWLAEQTAQWYNSKPESFTPVYLQEALDGRMFPDIWFLSDEILIGWQHYHISRILLSAHNPKLPRLGPSRAAAIKAMDLDIMEHVRWLVGMCLSNPDTAPNFTYASMAITMAGDKFTMRHEQEALLNVLNTCDKQYAWPTGHAQENLKAAWGWAEST